MNNKGHEIAEFMHALLKIFYSELCVSMSYNVYPLFLNFQDIFGLIDNHRCLIYKMNIYRYKYLNVCMFYFANFCNRICICNRV